MHASFWKTLKKPIIGLSPMDGVTDAAFRYIVDVIGHPHILFTEFTSVEGIAHGATKLLSAFTHHKTETPTVAQIFGSHPDDFYQASFVVAAMGFDGIDINMGCPDRSVTHRGGGAGLILKPALAKKIIRTVKTAMNDWSNGTSIEAVGLPRPIIDYVKNYVTDHRIPTNQQPLPVSVKTRIGYDHAVTEEWIGHLLETEPVAITIHGRTLKQMYAGKSDWEEIGRAAQLIGKTETLVLGNGDVKSVKEAREKSKVYHLDGVLIGRASLGNPWIFSGRIPTKKERLDTAFHQCEMFIKLTPGLHFLSLRKHLTWYMKGFEGSHELRARLMTVVNMEDVKKILNQTVALTGY